MSKARMISKASVRGFDENYMPHNSKGIGRRLFTKQSGATVSTLYEVLKKSPEVAAAVQAITEDIMADGWKYFGEEEKINEAKQFEIESSLYKLLANAIYDWLVTGNAYILKLSISDENMKELARSLSISALKAFKTVKNPDMFKKIAFEIIEQNTLKPKSLQLLKSSTVEINYDETARVLSYQQEVLGNERIYKPKDICHLSLINIGGEPYGFSPIEPLLSDVATLIFAKDYAGRFFENDGMPNFIFQMMKEHPDSPNYKKLVSELKELKKAANKVKSIALTGEIEIKEINKFNKDMEFAKLIQHFTQIILIALGVPAQRLNLSFEGRQNLGTSAKEMEGYYKRINFLQKILEHSLNKDIFASFGVRIKFNETYKLDEMREAQIAQIMAQIGAMSIQEIRERAGMDPEIPKGHDMPSRIGDESNIDFEQDKKDDKGQVDNKTEAEKTDNRTKELSNLQESLTKMKEELDIKHSELITLSNEIKTTPTAPDFSKITSKNLHTIQVSLDNSIKLDFDTFKRVVEKYTPFDKAYILLKEIDNKFVLYFSDRVWVFSTEMEKDEKFRQTHLLTAIRIQ